MNLSMLRAISKTQDGNALKNYIAGEAVDWSKFPAPENMRPTAALDLLLLSLCGCDTPRDDVAYILGQLTRARAVIDRQQLGPFGEPLDRPTLGAPAPFNL